MRIKYEPICKIELKHNYYKDQKMRDFSLQVIGGLNNNLRVHAESNNIGLYINKAASISPLQKCLVEPIKLYFNLQIHDHDSLSFTNLSLKQRPYEDFIKIMGERKYLFSNLTEDNDPLQREAFVSSTDEHILLRPNFDINIKVTDNNNQKIKILDQKGVSVYEKIINTDDLEIDTWKPLQIKLEENINVNQAYQFLLNETPITNLFFVSNPSIYNTWGIVELVIGEVDGKFYLIEKSTQDDQTSILPNFQQYTIHFDSRTIQYRYNLIPNNNSASRELKIHQVDLESVGMSLAEIASNVSALTGTQAEYEEENRTLPNGQTAISCLLKQTLKLEEKPTTIFLLEIKEETLDSMSIMLPQASKSGIKPLDANDPNENYLSDMYVYF